MPTPKKPSEAKASVAKAPQKPAVKKASKKASLAKESKVQAVSSIQMTPFSKAEAFPYQLKWQQAGLEFELFSDDAEFMGEQAWLLQKAMAFKVSKVGKTTVRKLPKTMPLPLQEPTELRHTQVLEKVLEFNEASPPERLEAMQRLPKEGVKEANGVDLEALKAWMLEATQRHMFQQQVLPASLQEFKTQIPQGVQSHIQAPVQQVQIPMPAPTQAVEWKETPPSHMKVSSVQTPSAVEAPQSPNIFETMMQDIKASFNQRKMDEETRTPPSNVIPSSFSNMLQNLTLQHKTDALLLTGFYLTQYQHVEAFNLSQLKITAEEAGIEGLTHGVLEASLTQRYIEIVPDLTGNATGMQYALTSLGQTYARQLLGHR